MQRFFPSLDIFSCYDRVIVLLPFRNEFPSCCLAHWQCGCGGDDDEGDDDDDGGGRV